MLRDQVQRSIERTKASRFVLSEVAPRWSGSVDEFLETIDPYVNPTAYGGTEADAFHVVLPSL